MTGGWLFNWKSQGRGQGETEKLQLTINLCRSVPIHTAIKPDFVIDWLLLLKFRAVEEHVPYMCMYVRTCQV